MINGNVNEFVDALYYGTENVFVFKQYKFMIQGWWKNDKYTLYMQLWEPPVEGHDWEYTAPTPAECVDKFLHAPLFDGKTFWEAEREMEWVDC